MENQMFSDISDTRIGRYLTSDVAACVGPRNEVYIEKFLALRQKGYSFNICAALFSSTWFAYRKMWNGALIIAVIETVYTVISFFARTFIFMTSSGSVLRAVLGSALTLPVLSFIVCGLAGDWFYCKCVTSVLDEHACGDRPPVKDEALESRLRESGGTTLTGLLIFLGVNLFVQYGIEILLTAMLGNSAF